MSDLYDSLEDDCSDNESSSDSLSQSNTESFRFDRALRKCVLQNSKILPEEEKTNYEEGKKAFLPVIRKNSRSESVIQLSTEIVDCKALNEKGLQLNNDGSFTKSPRQEKEELPFIAREYRNLQLQKKKAYSLTKRNSAVKSEKKIIRGKSEIRACPASLSSGKRKNKGSLEELEGSSKAGFQPSPNLTDSMKEKMLNTYREKNSKREEILKKGRTSYSETVQQVSSVNRKKTDAVKSEEFSKERKNSLTKKKFKETLSKQNLDILLKYTKPKLNYSERHQLESGFNPFYLRYENKRVPVDTNRSNFGDSEAEELPEISSRVVSCDNLRNDDEEKFYQKVMQRDKQKNTQHSSRSDGPLERLQFKTICGGNDPKGQAEVFPPRFPTLRQVPYTHQPHSFQISGRSNFRSKRNGKSMFIDLPPDTVTAENTSKKNFHYCSINSSPNMSKIELAQKAKTYGYLVNARNIFKLKAQSMATERLKSLKLNEKEENETENASLSSRRLIKQNSLPVNVFPRVKADSARNAGNIPRASASLCKPKQAEGQKAFVLPQVKGIAVRGERINARTFERLDFPLKTPNA